MWLVTLPSSAQKRVAATQSRLVCLYSDKIERDKSAIQKVFHVNYRICKFLIWFCR